MAVGSESQQKPSSAPIRGLNQDVVESQLGDEFSPDMTNVWVRNGVLEKRSGFATLLAGFPHGDSEVMAGGQFGLPSGTNHGLVFSRTGLVEYLHGTPDTWADRKGADPLTGDADYPIFAATVPTITDEYLYATNGKDTIKRWIGTGDWTTLSMTLPGAMQSLKAKCLIGYKGHLVLGAVQEGTTWYSFRIRWSKSATPANFDDLNNPSSGWINLVEDEFNSPIRCMLPLKEYLVVYKARGIYNLYYQGDPFYFVPEMRIADRGAIAPKAVDYVLEGEAHLMVGYDNIYLYEPYGFIKPFLGNRSKKKFFEELHWLRKGRIYVKSVPEYQECWILYPAGTSASLNRAMVWNWQYDSISYHTLGEGAYSMFTWGDLFDTRRALLGVQGNVRKLYTGNVDNTTAITATVRTALSHGGAKNLRKTIDRVDLDIAGTPNVRVGVAETPFETINWGASQVVLTDPNGIRFVNPHISGRYYTIEVSDSGSTERFQWDSYTPYFKPGGIR